MNHNDKVSEYEAHLRDSEMDIESALQVICPLTGEEVKDVRYLQYKALEEVQNALRGVYILYR